jgi:adenine phosphoribosyltransferase
MIKLAQENLSEEVKKSIRTIPDFPKKGILFRDITPLLLDGDKFKRCIDWFATISSEVPDYVISIESRGFIFGSALACRTGAGFVPVRKEGKLPHKTFRMSYELEYGQATLEIHTDAMKKGKKAIIIDDVLATGGTVQAAIKLAEKFDVQILGTYFLIELEALGGRKKLTDYPVHSLVSF